MPPGTGSGFGQDPPRQKISGGEKCACGHGYLTVNGLAAASGHRIALCNNSSCGVALCAVCGRDAVRDEDQKYRCAQTH